MIYSFTMALYSPSKGKHNIQKWDCNPTNAQLIFDHAVETMRKKLKYFPDSRLVLVNLDKQINFINQKILIDEK
jgi:hypothetical protein